MASPAYRRVKRIENTTDEEIDRRKEEERAIANDLSLLLLVDRGAVLLGGVEGLSMELSGNLLTIEESRGLLERKVLGLNDDCNTM